MDLENFTPHEKVELIKVVMHNQFEFRCVYDVDQIQFKHITQKYWIWMTDNFLRLIKDVLRLHGYDYSINEIAKIFAEDEKIYNVPLPEINDQE